MKKFVLAILCSGLLLSEATFATTLAVPGVDVSKGIGVDGAKYNADGTLAWGDGKVTKDSSAYGKDVSVDGKTARYGDISADGGGKNDLTPLSGASGSKDTGVSAGAKKAGTDTAGLNSAPLIKEGPVPTTGPKEVFLAFLALMIGSAVLFFRKKA